MDVGQDELHFQDALFPIVANAGNHILSKMKVLNRATKNPCRDLLLILKTGDLGS